MIGKEVGHYLIVEELGRGGMAVVYRARDRKLGREVALKFLPEKSASDPLAVERLQREARAASSLNHPGICSIFDLGEYSGTPFIAMELLQGESLHLLLRKQPIEPTDLLKFSAQVLDALDSAHSRGIIHRDIKPANIFITTEGRAKILDFGVAKPHSSQDEGDDGTLLTRPGVVVGTVAYMSPEQVRGETLDGRSDLYSFGVVLYEMATRQRPHAGSSQAVIIASILRETPVPPSALVSRIPSRLEKIILRALEKEPSLRYQSAREMLGDVESLRKELELQDSASPAIAARETPPQEATDAPGATATGTGALRSSLVGRDRELNHLRGFLAAAVEGRGNLVLLGGEAGIGKTRLARSVSQEARKMGMRVLTGRCYEMEGVPPYVPFLEILDTLVHDGSPDRLKEDLGTGAAEIARLVPALRQLIPDLPPALQLPPEQERHYLFGCLKEYFARSARSRPLLIIIEDLHWADDSTAMFLLHLAQSLPELPISILGTHRNFDSFRGAPLEKAAEPLISQRLAETVSIKPLDRHEVGMLLGHLGGTAPPEGVVSAIYGLTEGSPFYVEEVFKHLGEEGKLFDERGRWGSRLDLTDLKVPEGVRLVLNRRFRRLSEKARNILSVAAIIGQSFDQKLLLKAAGHDPEDVLDALEEGEVNRILIPSPDGSGTRCDFAHALIRNALLDELSLTRKQRIHWKVAASIESVFASNLKEKAPEMAHHLRLSGFLADPEKTLHFVKLAADQALAAAAFETALEFYEAGLAAERLDPPTRAELLRGRGLSLTGLVRWQEAQGDFEEALELFERQGAVEPATQLCMVMALQALWLGRTGRVVEMSERGLAMLGDAPIPARCRLLAWAGDSHNLDGDLAAGSRFVDRAVEVARQMPGDQPLGHALRSRSSQMFLSHQADRQVETGLQAIELLKDDPWDLADALSMTQLGRLWQGRTDDCRQLGAELVPLAKRLGHMGCLWMCQRCFGMSDLMNFADFDAFEAFARMDMDLCRQGNIRWISHSHTWLGVTTFWRGDWERAGTHFEEALKLQPEDFSRGIDWQARLLWLAYTGRREESLSEAAAYEGHLPRPEVPSTAGSWGVLFGLAEAYAVLAENERAASLYPLFREILQAGTAIQFNAFGLTEKVAGIAAAAARKWEVAETHFQAALQRADAIPFRVEQGEVRRWYARMLTERNAPGDIQHARKYLEEAIAKFQELGMARHRQMALSALTNDLQGN